MTERRVEPEIIGGAGPDVSAAILAVVQTVLDEEAAARGTPPRRFVPGPWVLAARPRMTVTPVQEAAPGPLDWVPDDQEDWEEP